ncbi:hypothetical protein [Dokdonella ginsengisoli]|uniref:Uncharacterized protein n=1 Tax=Dokdonella ginsengisoli TaxID=363846 RepID=A0ABV9QWC1_9GAMM
MATERELLKALEINAIAYQKGGSENFDHDFAIASLLNKRGYFMVFNVHTESQTSERAVDFFSVNRLSARGRARLAELEDSDEQGEI